jgi:phage FluMu protein Com
MSAPTATDSSVRVKYVHPHEIRCGGTIAGGRLCRRLLGRDLVGRIEIKCPECNYISTYIGRPISLDDFPTVKEPEGPDPEPFV